MAHTRTKGRVVFECDECGEVQDNKETSNDFRESWSNAKDSGWKTYKHDDEFVHYCPDCAESN